MIQSRWRQAELDYHFSNGVFCFSDGVEYTLAEALHVCRVPHQDLKLIHALKKAFDGEIITTPPVAPRYQPMNRKRDTLHPNLRRYLGLDRPEPEEQEPEPPRQPVQLNLFEKELWYAKGRNEAKVDDPATRGTQGKHGPKNGRRRKDS